MVSSVVELCNMALTMLGVQRISSLSESTEAASLCSLLYTPVLDEALRQHPWRFATTRQVLAQPSITNMTSYEYVYQLPQDPYCLRILALLNEDYIEQTEQEYMVEGRNLYTDLEAAALKFVGRPSDPTKLDSSFVWYMANLLAARMAFKLFGDKKTATQAEGMAMVALQRAKEFDAMEGTMRPVSNDFWTEQG